MSDVLPRSDGCASPDQKKDKDVERRQAVNAARLDKILNHKEFTIGQDVEAVDAQRAEKAAAIAAEQKFEAEVATHVLNVDKKLCFMEMQKQRAHKDWEHKVAEFNGSIIGTGDTQDLEDKRALQKDLPTRQGDDDPRLGASSFQIFQGEDLDAQKRKVRQQQQMKAIIEQQVVEKAVIKKQEEALEAQNAERMKQIHALRTQVEEQEINLRRQIETIRLNANAENIVKKKEQLAEDPMFGLSSALNAMEQIAANNNPVLIESDKLPRTDGKPDCTNFKGHTKESWLACQDAQNAQVAEKRAQQQADKAFDRKVDASAKAVSTNASFQMFEAGKRKKEHMRLIAEENLRAAAAKKANDAEAKKEAAFCTPEYLAQWGNSAR